MTDWIAMIFADWIPMNLSPGNLEKEDLRGLSSWSVRHFWQELGGDTTAYHIKGNCWQGVAETLGTSPSLLAFWLWKNMDFMRRTSMK